MPTTRIRITPSRNFATLVKGVSYNIIMKDLLHNLIKTSSIKLATKPVIKRFIESPGYFRDIKGSINSYAIFNDDYYVYYKAIFNKLRLSFPMEDLRLFLDILIVNYKTEKKNLIDQSDIYLCSHFFPLNIIPFLYTPKINSFCYGYAKYYKLQNSQANKYKLYDFLRRLQILRFNFSEILKIYDPYRYEQLSEKEKIHLDFLLNSIYPNIVSILDSLAFILQFEFNVIPNIDLNNRKDRTRISLFNRNFLQTLRDTNISIFQEWFNEIKELRHAMVHRMPFYNVQIFSTEETKLFQQKKEELDNMSVEYLRKLDVIREEYNKAIKEESERYQEIYKEMDKVIKVHDEQTTLKHQEIVSIGSFTGIFTDDAYENTLHHISRTFLDINKMYMIIDIVLKYIKNKKLNNT